MKPVLNQFCLIYIYLFVFFTFLDSKAGEDVSDSSSGNLVFCFFVVVVVCFEIFFVFTVVVVVVVVVVVGGGGGVTVAVDCFEIVLFLYSFNVLKFL